MHVTREQLERFASGRTSAAESADIESHLLECDACGRALDELDISGDPLVNFFRVGLTSKDGEDQTQSSMTKAGRPIISPAEAAIPAGSFLIPTGTNFARYRISEPLGQGGMGVVYEAFDTTLRRKVALKVIDPRRLMRQEAKKRFRREAELAAQLQHPNIVQIFDFGEHESTMFCAFELIRGGDLAEYLVKQHVSQEEAAQMISILADAVDYAHQQQVVHRDIKPANILFDAQKEPRIADFGLAKRLDEETSDTVDGTLMGSPSYMAPEQAEGDVNAVGPATDVYALGAVLYELLTGQPPFRAQGVLATLDRVKNSAPRPPSEKRPEIDPRLESVCLQCLNKQPSDRYITAAALAADLRCFLAGEPVAARNSSWSERLAMRVRRQPWIAASTLLSIVLFVVLAAVGNRFLFVNSKHSPEPGEIVNVREAFATRLQRVARDNGSVRVRELLLDEEQCPVELRDFCWSLLLSRCPPDPTHWQNVAEVFSLAISPDESVFATGDQQGNLRIWSLTGRAPTREIADAHAGAINAVVFSPDGTQLVSVDSGAPGIEHGTIRIWNWPSMTSSATIEPRCGRINSVAFSPIAEYMATAHSDGVVRMWTPESQQPASELMASNSSLLRVSYSANGRWLAAGDREGIVRLWDANTGKLATTQDGFGTELRFHPDRANLLAIASADFVLQLWQVGQDAELVRLQRFASFQDTISQVAFSNGLVAAGSYDGTTQVYDIDSKNRIHLQRSKSRISAVAFANQKSLLTAARDGTIQQQGFGVRQNLLEIDAHASRSVIGVAILEGNRKVVSAGSDGALRIWDVRGGELIAEWVSAKTSVAGMAVNHRRSRFLWQADGVPYVGRLEETKIQASPIQLETTFADRFAFSRDGKTLAFSGSLGLDCVGIDKNSADDTWTWDAESILSVTSSPVANRFAVATESGSVWLIDPNKKHRTHLIDFEGLVPCLAFDTDGKRLAVSLENGDVAIVDTDEGVEELRLRGHATTARCIRFTPDGKTLATASFHGEIRFWDAVVGDERLMLQSPQGLLDLSFSADSKTLAAAFNDGFVRIWKTEPLD